MSKTHSFDFRKGSLIDSISGVVASHNGTEFIRSDKGLAIKGNGDGTSLTLSSNIPISTLMSEVVEFTYDGSGEQSISAGTLHGAGMHMRLSGTTIYFQGYDDASKGVTFLHGFKKNQTYHLIFLRDGIDVYFWRNGEYIGTSSSMGITENLEIPEFLDRNGNDYGSNSYLHKWELYNHLLTEKERAKLYSEFLRSTPTTKTIQ